MLGLCCHYLKVETKPKTGEKVYVNEMDERVLQLGRYRDGKYTQEAIKATYIGNARNLAVMLPKIRHAGFKHFRISSALFPLADQVPRALWDNPDVSSQLKRAGDFVKANDMRVTTHPGQFTVLSSNKDSVIEKAIVELHTHAWLFDTMGLDNSAKWAINIHGGVRGNGARLIEVIKSLPENIRKRLTLENDENCYSVADLLEVYQATGVPIVFDSHHHVFNDGGLTMDEAFDASCETWSGIARPLQHISNTEPSLSNGSVSERRKHSDYIHYVPDPQLRALRDDTIDLEVEAKMKNLAIHKMCKDFDVRV